MKTMLTVVGLAFTFSFLTGCAETGSSMATAPTTPTAATAAPGKWERKVLANGVELLISEEAGVDARKVAEDIQAEMRSRYIGAR